jgi:hypothetical protein
MVSACRRRGVACSITTRKNAAIRRAIDAIPDDAWMPIPYWLDGGAVVAETTYTAFAGTRHETTAHQITDPDRALGPEPHHPTQRAYRQRVCTAIKRVHAKQRATDGTHQRQPTSERPSQPRTCELRGRQVRSGPPASTTR